MSKIRSSLVSIMNSEEVDSTYYRIAKYLLQNNYIVNHVSMEEVAKICFCAKSTVSRFCRQIGYENYYELNQDLYNSTRKSQDKYDKYKTESFEDSKDIFLEDLYNGIATIKHYVNETVINDLIQDIKFYDEVGVFGNMQSHSTAQKFQNDLGLLRKIITCSSLPKHQKAYVEQANANTLIVIISFSGYYFRNYINPKNYSITDKPKFILITCNEKMKHSDLYDTVVYLPCKDNYANRAHIISIFLNFVSIQYSKTTE